MSVMLGTSPLSPARTGDRVAVIVPGFSGFYMLGLRSLMPCVDTSLVLLARAGVLVVVGALMAEARRVELVSPNLGLVPAAHAFSPRQA